MRAGIRKILSLSLAVCCLAGSVLGCSAVDKYRILEKEILKEETDSEYRGAEDTESLLEDVPLSEESTEWSAEEAADKLAFEENYAYSTLDNETKKVYDEVLAAILEQKEEVTVSTVETDVLEKAYKAVCADYGGLFWVSGYVYTQYTRGGKLIGIDRKSTRLNSSHRT